MSDRLSSGSERLDTVLGGGLPLHGITLIVGPPGCGQNDPRGAVPVSQREYRSAGAVSVDGVGTTGEDPAIRRGPRLLRRLRAGHRVIYDDLGQTLNKDGLPGVLARITELLKQRRPGVMVIDSFKALQVYAPDAGAFRRFLHDLAGLLSAMPITTFWVGEYDDADTVDAPEFAVADAIMSLSTDRIAEREMRGASGSEAARQRLPVREAHLPALPEGPRRLPAPGRSTDLGSYGDRHERMSSGVPALDAMLCDGYYRGASTLLAGPSGVGKTLLALHFVFAGARRGETGVIATFQENPVQLQRILQGFSWSLHDPHIELMYRSPVDLYLDEWLYDLLDTVQRTGAQRLAIDSLGDMRAACVDELRFRECVYSLLQRCTRANVSVIMTQEVPDLFGVTRLSEYGISHLSDNVVLLQFLRGDSELKRAITVLKTRGSAHEQQLRQYAITSDGVTLGDAFAPSQSLV